MNVTLKSDVCRIIGACVIAETNVMFSNDKYDENPGKLMVAIVFEISNLALIVLTEMLNQQEAEFRFIVELKVYVPGFTNTISEPPHVNLFA
jgi:hypothetical protein